MKQFVTGAVFLIVLLKINISLLLPRILKDIIIIPVLAQGEDVFLNQTANGKSGFHFA